MGPHNSYVRAEAAFQLATWQNERMPRVLSTAVAGGFTCTLTLLHLHVPLPFTPALSLPSLHLSLCYGLENRFLNSVFRQIALRTEASSSHLISYLISSYLAVPQSQIRTLLSLCCSLRCRICSCIRIPASPCPTTSAMSPPLTSALLFYLLCPLFGRCVF